IKDSISRITRLPTRPIMSFKVSADGSPTSRKGVSHFSIAEDLRSDASSEVTSAHWHQPFHLPVQHNQPLNPNAQGIKHPLGHSSQGNHMVPLRSSLDSFKVSHLGSLL